MKVVPEEYLFFFRRKIKNMLILPGIPIMDTKQYVDISATFSTFCNMKGSDLDELFILSWKIDIL